MRPGRRLELDARTLHKFWSSTRFIDSKTLRGGRGAILDRAQLTLSVESPFDWFSLLPTTLQPLAGSTLTHTNNAPSRVLKFWLSATGTGFQGLLAGPLITFVHGLSSGQGLAQETGNPRGWGLICSLPPHLHLLFTILYSYGTVVSQGRRKPQLCKVFYSLLTYVLHPC
jgi:hypothetical protein